MAQHSTSRVYTASCQRPILLIDLDSTSNFGNIKIFTADLLRNNRRGGQSLIHGRFPIFLHDSRYFNALLFLKFVGSVVPSEHFGRFDIAGRGCYGAGVGRVLMDLFTGHDTVPRLCLYHSWSLRRLKYMLSSRDTVYWPLLVMSSRSDDPTRFRSFGI